MWLRSWLDQILSSISNTLGVWTLFLVWGPNDVGDVGPRALLRLPFRKTADNIVDYGSKWEDIADECF